MLHLVNNARDSVGFEICQMRGSLDASSQKYQSQMGQRIDFTEVNSESTGTSTDESESDFIMRTTKQALPMWPDILERQCRACRAVISGQNGCNRCADRADKEMDSPESIHATSTTPVPQLTEWNATKMNGVTLPSLSEIFASSSIFPESRPLLSSKYYPVNQEYYSEYRLPQLSPVLTTQRPPTLSPIYRPHLNQTGNLWDSVSGPSNYLHNETIAIPRSSKINISRSSERRVQYIPRKGRPGHDASDPNDPILDPARPYHCHYCYKSYRKANERGRHENSCPSNPFPRKNYRCRNCGFAMARSDNLKTHEKKCFSKVK